jgi:hypothetical protein
VKPPDPRGTRERDTALSEKQASLRSNVRQAGMRSADRRHRGMECRAYLLAHGAAVTCWDKYFSMPREPDPCSCASQRNMEQAGRLGTSPGCKASGLATTVVRALREGRQAPLRMLAGQKLLRVVPFRRCPLDLPPILLSSARFPIQNTSRRRLGDRRDVHQRGCSSAEVPGLRLGVRASGTLAGACQ